MAHKKKAIKHVGFEAAAKEAAKSYGGNIKKGKAVIAAAARAASPSAKKANPRLAKVLPKKKGKKS